MFDFGFNSFVVQRVLGAYVVAIALLGLLSSLLG